MGTAAQTAKKPMYYTEMDSPVGLLRLAGDGETLKVVEFAFGKWAKVSRADWEQSEKPFAEVIDQLRAYFAGQRKEFDLVLELQGTPFQVTVWEALRTIPYGQTISYAELARRIGNPQAVRAVGLANGSNPIPIIVPCHRVIGSNGSLTGFGGGLENKQKLLALESGQLKLL
jgi:methylated-DNA-[protein]-cysteine S-methyltransferase